MFEFPPARTELKTTTNSPAGFSLAGVIFISGHGVSTILGYRVKSKWARGSRERGFSRYYSASPNASVIRIDLLDLTIADAGITLDLDKDWHPDLYVKCDTKH